MRRSSSRGRRSSTAARLLALGRVAVEELAKEFGTPLYVLDRAELVGRMRHYRQAFGPATTVVYASKALCVVGVLQLAAAEGLAVDVASAGELHTALLAGVDPATLVVHGNNKSDAELADAVAAGAGRIVVDGPGELTRVGALGRDRGRAVDVLLRVTPGIDAATHAAIATGGDTSKFGFSLPTGMAHEGVAAALAEPGVHLTGLHAHVGSNIRDPETFAAAAQRLCDLRAEIAQQPPRRAARPQPRGRPGDRLRARRRGPAARGLRRGPRERARRGLRPRAPRAPAPVDRARPLHRRACRRHAVHRRRGQARAGRAACSPRSTAA